MLYALLPNKKQTTYKKFFKMVKSSVTKSPLSINIDYEKAVMNAASLVFGDECKINGCFFHFSQSLFRRIQTHGMLKDYYNPQFRKTFKLIQALAYLPPGSVIKGFGLIKSQAPSSSRSLLDYFENTYIGRCKPHSKTARANARYPIGTWNVYERVKSKKPRTTNNLESWHCQIQIDEYIKI
jgi:hypothetical protein